MGTCDLNDVGEIVACTWHDLPNHVSNMQLDMFVVMPNHIHGIMITADPVVGAGSEPAPTEPAPTEPAPAEPAPTTTSHGLPEIIRAFKTFTARRINVRRSTPGVPVWQRNYHEHIIRNEETLNRIRQYIHENPARWELDRENPDFVAATHATSREDEPCRI
jgi:putative transposase